MIRKIRQERREQDSQRRELEWEREWSSFNKLIIR